MSAKLLKILLAVTPFVFDKMLFEREVNDIEIGDVASEIGPPTSIGGDSAFGGLLPEFCDVLMKRMNQKYATNSKSIFQLIILKIAYLKPGDGEPALPEQDCDID